MRLILFEVKLILFGEISLYLKLSNQTLLIKIFLIDYCIEY